MQGNSERERLARKRSGRRHGGAVIEASLLLPWLFFLFVGAIDLGFYTYGLVTVENAARSAAIWASQSTTNATNSAAACANYVMPALALLGNVPSSASCNSSSLAVTTASPVALTLTSPTPLDGSGVSAVRVTVWYQTPPLPVIPGILPGRTILKRAVTMRVQQ
jgi:Flp pilus assembly protein TadG